MSENTAHQSTEGNRTTNGDCSEGYKLMDIECKIITKADEYDYEQKDPRLSKPSVVFRYLCTSTLLVRPSLCLRSTYPSFRRWYRR